MTQRELKERLDPKWDDVQVGSSDDFGDIEEICDVEGPTDGPFARDYVRLCIVRGAIVND